MKDLLDYLTATPVVKTSLFTDDELRQMLTLALDAGKSNDLSKKEFKVLDSMIFKLERVLTSLDICVAQQKQEAEKAMER